MIYEICLYVLEMNNAGNAVVSSIGNHAVMRCYLLKGGYVFSCAYLSVCLSVCLSVNRVTQKLLIRSL